MEVIKSNCLISVVPDFIKLKKYNINELWDKKEQPSDDKKEDDDKKSSQEEAETIEVKVE